MHKVHREKLCELCEFLVYSVVKKIKPQSAQRRHKAHEENFANSVIKEKQRMTENEISKKIIGCALEVHRALGPGLLESAYQECLFYKLRKEHLFVEKEKPMPLVFEGVSLEVGYRMDLLVENKVVIELKSVVALNEVHLAQTLTYLKLGDYKLGLLINFNVALLKSGIKRVINGDL